MKDLTQVTKAITHASRFHLDDVMSTALIKSINSNIVVERVLDYVGEGQDNEIVYDIGGGQFDHHQPNRQMNRVGCPYSSFGLLWQAYGKQLLSAKGFSNIDKAFDLFQSMYTERVDEGDNFGYRDLSYFPANDVILQFNLKWYEDNTSQDMQFAKAVDIAIEILDNWLREVYRQVEKKTVENDIWHKAEQSAKDGIVVLQERIPWREQLKEHPDSTAKLIIFESERGGYSIVSRDVNEIQIADSKYIRFLHPSKFMAVADTLEDALAVAQATIDNQQRGL